MKLDYKKTFYIGIIFFSISLFWQAYDMLVARILIDKFGLNQTWSGIVMAVDNMLAVFLLPLFGYLSDKKKSKLGKRTPYIIIGTVCAAFAFMGLAFSDQYQTLKIEHTNLAYMHDEVAFDESKDVYSKAHWEDVISIMYVERTESFEANQISNDQYKQFISTHQRMSLIIENTNEHLSHRDISHLRDLYYTYLSSKAWEITAANPINFIVFSAILFIALVAMAIYRSPAVALMPDITVKTLRSKANAIINFMGALGGIIAVNILIISKVSIHPYKSHTTVFITVGLIMLFTLGIFLWKVKENQWGLDKEKEELELKLSDQDEDEKTSYVLSKDKKRALYLLLASVFLWFFGYNAVMSKIADYLPKVLNINFSSLPFLIAQVFVIITILPIGFLTSKIGRKKSVLLGIIIATLSLASITFLNEQINYLAAVSVAAAGVGWIMINVNSYPMVVELGRGTSIGKYTGYYYAASMAAQIFTPIFSGILMDAHGRMILFPYAAFFVVLSFLTMMFVKHGDHKPKTRFLDA